MTAEAAALRHYLDAQRTSAVAILGGLSDEQLRTSALPGWTPIGLIKHLADAERHWFQRVFAGAVADDRWLEDDENPLSADHPTAEILAFYRAQCDHSNAVLATTPLDATPIGQHPGGDPDNEVADLRGIALHMIEETARHLGHLDVARELIDGRTGLGPR
ncbi:DinB family protein [Nocardioides terrae]|uniref:DinB family protein n=1 Tax=Nocardioides terrae TaxID=574651 RepID=UPI001FDFB621|nr:DinB family protein [Nocardioides terrae]